MRLTVTLTDPPDVFDVEFDARDRRAFERAGARALGITGPLQAAVQSMPDTYVAWLAWHATARRNGREVGGFDEFDARLIDVTPHEDEPATESGDLGDPTKPAQSAG
jgi:hypothetical protein